MIFGNIILRKTSMSTFISSLCSDLQAVKQFDENGIDIQVNNSAIFYASVRGHLEVVKYLVGIGADFQANYNEAVRMASAFGHLEVVKYLVEMGADFQDLGNCAVRFASLNGHLEVVKYLVEKGADFRADDNEAIIVASGNGHLEVVKYLAEMYTDFRADDTLRVKCLKTAVINGRYKVAEYLTGD